MLFSKKGEKFGCFTLTQFHNNHITDWWYELFSLCERQNYEIIVDGILRKQ